MSKYKTFFNPEHLYFITTSLFNKEFQFLNKPPYVNLILENLEFLRREKRILLFAFAIMPNHLHLIIKVLEPYTTSQIMHSLKSFSSTKLKKLMYKNDFKLWQEIKKYGGKVWQEGFFDENIYSPEFLLEKIEYVHNNPINKGWQLAKQRENYKYSSACFYDLGIKSVIDIDDVKQML